jgi:uncharacterized protein involved in type VI secretion and phage assembly
MVHKHVWEAAGMTAGFLCIGCLEARLGPPTMPRRFHERTDQQSRRPMAYASPRRATYQDRGSAWEFERELIRARTDDGRKRAQARGVRFGRPLKLAGHQRQEVAQRLAEGAVLRCEPGDH